MDRLVNEVIEHEALNNHLPTNLEDQIRLHKTISQKIDELEKKKKTLSFEIMQQMQSKTLQLGGFIVRRISRIQINLSLEEARILDAVKWEESVDKNKVKALYQSGQSIQGVKEIEYIQISSLE